MCGIAGIINREATGQIDRDSLDRMTDALAHRGPDGRGIHIEPGVGLGHRRLAIIDVSSGQQPLFNEDESVVVIYNGELYNFQELSVQLKARGHRFRTECDTEVVVHAWEEWGNDCVERFRGMFAFALWDRKQRTLFMARDRLGIKPLHYAQLPNGQLIFASELKGLLVHPDLPREMDHEAVEDFFAFGYIPDPRTILRHVRKLLPGFTLTIAPSYPGISVNQYWDLEFNRSSNSHFREAQAELTARLQEAVKMRLISDVPLGAFLSGGVDSSAVVAMMAGVAGARVNTCSISFGEREFDEARYARMVANRYDTNHYVGRVASDDFDLIDRLSDVYDEPFADSSALPTYRLCELARQHVTVCLSGDGGDETFAGYPWYQTHMRKHRVRSAIPGPIRKPLFGTLGRIVPKADWAPRIFRTKTTFETLAMDPIASFARSAMITTDRDRKALFTDTFRRSLHGYNAIEVLRGHAAAAETDHPLSLVQYLDFKVYLPADILTKVDRASMAHSLEVRVPILDHKLVEWTAQLDATFKYGRGVPKQILKKAMEPYLSPEILYRRKMGFSIPLSNWLRGPLRDRVHSAVMNSELAHGSIFDRQFLKRVFRQHNSGRRNHASLLWALLTFETFHRRLFGCKPSVVAIERSRHLDQTSV